MGAGATFWGTFDATSKGAVKSTGSAARTASGISIPCGLGTAIVTPARAAKRRVESILTAARGGMDVMSSKLAEKGYGF